MEAIEFIKVSVENEIPAVDGKYIVYTKTKMGNGNTFEVSYHLDDKNRPNWSCNNQIVTHWLKPTVFYTQED